MVDPSRSPWVLRAGLCLLALLSGGISADKSTWNNTDLECPRVLQHPHYVVARRDVPLHLICYTQDAQGMRWYRTMGDSDELHELNNTSRYSIQRNNSLISLSILSISPTDRGLYVCGTESRVVPGKQLHLCAMELQVLGHSTRQQIQNRQNLKDATIIIQSILLVIFISIPMLLFLGKGEGKQSPEEEHTYEGLAVEQMATYEDITPFRDVKAKWTVGEHPGEE
ncbi:B-cell antigen receptor complex-associated protein beta chain [Heliangelus exortis]|uniref:B-cell antigen receptor complex-associated protein beta chain n=1 Tax=Heliangelus exortis TaxID=472823 RepID=UPI003A94CBA6